jgi:hypothetical protein
VKEVFGLVGLIIWKTGWLGWFPTIAVVTGNRQFKNGFAAKRGPLVGPSSRGYLTGNRI